MSVSTKLRCQILLRDQYTCQKCGTYKNLEVHHIQEKSNGGSDAPDNLITLCHTCHVQHHSKLYRIYCNFRDRATDYGMKRFRACEQAFYEQFGIWPVEVEDDTFRNFQDEFNETYD